MKINSQERDLGSGVVNIFRDWTVSMGFDSVGFYKLARLLLWLHTECGTFNLYLRMKLLTNKCLLGNCFNVTPTSNLPPKILML